MNNYSQYDLKQLIQLVSQNDEVAFTELYNRFWKKLFAVAYNRLQEIEGSEDVVHDVFAGLWANRHRIEIELVENYLATSVKYAVLKRMKKKARERLYQKTEHQAPVIELPQETSLHYKRILELVTREVERLPEKCRLIFKYSRNEGMPVRQIAERLSISPKTVENQLYKALRQLKLAAKSLLQSILY